MNVNSMNWQGATLGELAQIIRFESCPIPYKCYAEVELEKRLQEYGMVYEL